MPRLKSNEEGNRPEPSTVKPPKRGRKYAPKFIEDPADATEAVAEAVAATGDATYEPEGGLTDIWERRLLNPDAQKSTPIRINTPGMHLRWINLSNNGRYQRARYEQGWVPVNRTELVDEREIGGVSYTSEGFVCRGQKQGEMLMKMPQAIFKKIRDRRADLNRKSYEKLSESLQGAGASHFSNKYGAAAGEQAAEAAASFRGQVRFGSEQASSDELLD